MVERPGYGTFEPQDILRHFDILFLTASASI
jgi:hypothetical protein